MIRAGTAGSRRINFCSGTPRSIVAAMDCLEAFADPLAHAGEISAGLHPAAVDVRRDSDVLVGKESMLEKSTRHRHGRMPAFLGHCLVLLGRAAAHHAAQNSARNLPHSGQLARSAGDDDAAGCQLGGRRCGKPVANQFDSFLELGAG